MNHSFLNAIADGYLRDPELTHYTFVFPNMRSRRYFAERLAAGGVDERRAASMCLTLTRLVEETARMNKTSGERLLYVLYAAYCRVRTRLNPETEPETFDRFRYWGQMLLRDFDDVDRAMADPVELFRNVEDYKEIQSFYLTPAQEKIIREYWGDDPYWSEALNRREQTDDLPFWNHVDPTRETPKKFTQLWAMLGEIYAEFRRMLAESGECYPAMAYRRVAESLVADSGALPFGPSLYVFIGFSRLTHAELTILDRLRDKAHFYWDYDPTLMGHCGPSNSAGRFVGGYARKFTARSPYVELPQRPATHRVEVIGVPSAVGQAKVAAQCLTDNNAALVLADESMLLPVMASVPRSRFSRLNVTMGYPLRHSSLAQFYTLLTSMQMRASFDSAGRAVFFHDDVIALLSHPSLRAAMPGLCAALINHMRANGLYNLPIDRIDGQFAELLPLFGPIAENASAREVGDYIAGAMDFAVGHGMVSRIDGESAEVIKSMIDQIVGCCDEFGVETGRRTFFEIIERTLMQRTLPLEGETFDALQIMGVLETRSLGFENVVMLSMSDDIYPGRNQSRSFIPESLRRAYGLPTNDHLEAEQAYHFYRILSHARHMTLIYDARCGALRQGEMSRYLTQLRYLNFPGVEFSMSLASFGNPAADRTPLIPAETEVSKSPEMCERVEAYANGAKLETHRLSASALKSYLNCPLEFFLSTIEDIDIPEPDAEEPGAAEHGSVIHAVAERVYSYFMEHHGGMVNRDDLESLCRGGFDGMIDRELTRAMKTHLMNCPDDAQDRTVLGEKEMMYYRPLKMTVESLLRRDMADAPFRILGVEASETFVWHLSNGRTVNFRYIIDRIDKLIRPDGDIIRIIDYKTGTDSISFESVESLFSPDMPNRPAAIFQLLLYCEAYKSLHPEVDTSRLRPQIFRLKDFSQEWFPLLQMGSRQKKKVEIESYAQVEDAFREALNSMFDDIFDPTSTIRRATKEECCKWCYFKQLCH